MLVRGAAGRLHFVAAAETPEWLLGPKLHNAWVRKVGIPSRSKMHKSGSTRKNGCKCKTTPSSPRGASGDGVLVPADHPDGPRSVLKPTAAAAAVAVYHRTNGMEMVTIA